MRAGSGDRIAFTRGRVERLQTREIVAGLLDGLAARIETFGLVSQVAVLLPVTVTCELLGNARRRQAPGPELVGRRAEHLRPEPRRGP